MFVRIHDFKQIKSIYQYHKKVMARNNKIQMIFPYQKDHRKFPPALEGFLKSFMDMIHI